jgi:hypothetical protein|tara:strand:- start:3 stop:233 length:231 start_codon:yes stop_codon:yes gene_type:complete
MKQLRFIFLLLLINCDKDDPLDESCLLVPDPGLCQAAFPRYYYNSETDKCTQFLWGGCGGVVPFETLEECKNACGS